jgi:methylated-DNA-[protein]-cysteine S-methyltransferase
MERVIVQATPFGPVAIVWSLFRKRPKIIRVLLPKPGLSAKRQVLRYFPALREESCAEMCTIAKKIEAFLSGEDVAFPLNVARLEACSAFQQSVLRAEHRIPRGRVSTYRLIAAHLGRPHGARAVGNALSSNPFPILVPCHRAIRSDRTLGGYQGGIEMKRALLEAEGIAFDRRGRAMGAQLHYERREQR